MDIAFPEPLNALISGLENKAITNFYGAPGTGKTNFCLLAAIDCVRKGGKVIYIDTEGGLSFRRLKQLAFDHEKVLERMEISSDELHKTISERLENDSPGESKRNISVNSTASELYHWESHREAYGLGSEKVGPIHYILALLKLPDDHWIKDILPEKGLIPISV